MDERADNDPAGRKGGEVAHHEPARYSGESALVDEEQETARLSRLVGQGDVETARDLIARLVVAFPDSPRIRHWARVLAPPTTRSQPPLKRRSFAAERAWLRAHAREYPGCWLAILGDRLLAAGPDLREVVDRIHHIEGGTDALLHLRME